jgi:hypothetical protein
MGSGLAPQAPDKQGDDTMKKLAAAVMFAVCCASPAFATDTGMMHSAFGNTVVVTEPSGAIYRYHFNADGSFDVVTPDRTINGTYTVANGQICVTYTGRTQSECTAYAGEKNVGDTWTQNGSDGHPITITLQAGR